MLDLAKPLGTHEGLIFYGDHELTDLVYYFPDEVSLAPQVAPMEIRLMSMSCSSRYLMKAIL